MTWNMNCSKSDYLSQKYRQWLVENRSRNALQVIPKQYSWKLRFDESSPKRPNYGCQLWCSCETATTFFWKVISGTKISTIVTVKQSMHLAFSRLPYEACVHPILKQNPFELGILEILLVKIATLFQRTLKKCFQTDGKHLQQMATNHQSTLL